jgi:CheY-like chemotaxis protein/two-component sensor histidine kinase
MLGHELRNPLAPILSSLELLERRASGPNPQLAVLRRQAQHLVRLVDDLLDVSRISRGKIELVRQHVSMQTLLQRAVEMCQPLITQREHQLELDVDDQLVLLADEARLAQVVANLLTNAAKYTQIRGKLRVSGRAEGGLAVIRVRDNGIGIARELLPMIFDMFVQGRQAIDREMGGLGLGLTIVRNIVQLHGGTVEAHSEGAGLGSELVVRLPIAHVPADLSPTPSLTLPSQPRQLLIIDDNEDAAVSLGDLLTARGHSVQIVHHPSEALRFFERKPPEVALVDIGLPSMDGYELARRLRAQPGGKVTRLIAVTGYGQPSDRAKAKDAGFDAHLVKPVSPDRLEALIASLYSTSIGTS